MADYSGFAEDQHAQLGLGELLLLPYVSEELKTNHWSKTPIVYIGNDR